MSKLILNVKHRFPKKTYLKNEEENKHKADKAGGTPNEKNFVT